MRFTLLLSTAKPPVHSFTSALRDQLVVAMEPLKNYFYFMIRVVVTVVV